MTVRILFGLAALMSVVMLDMPPAAAMTLDQAMEWCSKRYGHLYDQNGAPRMATAIEDCARDKAREVDAQPTASSKRKKKAKD